MLMNMNKLNVRPWSPIILVGVSIGLLFSAAVAGVAMSLDIQPQSAPAAANQSTPYGHVYKIGKGVTPPAPLSTVDAEFPPSARNLKAPFQQIVIVRLIVDASGNPRDVHVIRSYNRDFDAQAVKAVDQYHFIPAKKAGKPVAVALSIEVNFKKY